MRPHECPNCGRHDNAIPSLYGVQRTFTSSGRCINCSCRWECHETQETSERHTSTMRIRWLGAKGVRASEFLLVRTRPPDSLPPDLDLYARRLAARTYECGNCHQRFLPGAMVAIDWERELLVHAGGCPKAPDSMGAEQEERDADSAEQQVAAAERGHELHASRLTASGRGPLCQGVGCTTPATRWAYLQGWRCEQHKTWVLACPPLEQTLEWMVGCPPAPTSQPERPAKPASLSGRLAALASRCWTMATLPVVGAVAFLGMAWGRSKHERLPGEYQDR